MLIMPNGKNDCNCVLGVKFFYALSEDECEDSGTKLPWVWILALLVISCMISAKCYKPVCTSVSSFAKWSLWGPDQVTHIKDLENCLGDVACKVVIFTEFLQGDHCGNSHFDDEVNEVIQKGCDLPNVVHGVRNFNSGYHRDHILNQWGCIISAGQDRLHWSSKDSHIAMGWYERSLFLTRAMSPSQDGRGILLLIFTQGPKFRGSFLRNASMTTVAGEYATQHTGFESFARGNTSLPPTGHWTKQVPRPGRSSERRGEV